MITKKKSQARKLLEDITNGPLTLGRVIRAIRLSEEISQTQFSKKLKISVSHLCDIEMGRKVVSPERAVRFAKILGRAEKQFVRLALQQVLENSGIKMRVNVEVA